MNKVYIYGLMEPHADEIRYVGQTKNVVKRLQSHCIEARTRKGARRLSWIRSLLSKDLKPRIVVLEVCEGKEWVECEQFWIAYLSFIGSDLTNGTMGGEGMEAATAETRLKMSESAKARGVAHLNTSEVKSRSIESRIGLKRSPQTRAKMSASQKGKPRTPGSNAKRAASLTGDKNHFFGRQHSAETKEQIRTAKLLNPHRHELKQRTLTLISPEGVEVTVKNLSLFCKTHGIHSGSLYKVMAGKRNHACGWTLPKEVKNG